jgi:hypothetical protein
MSENEQEKANDIKEYLVKLQELKGDNNWKEIRSSENNFQLVEKDYYNLGNKKIFYPIEEEKNLNLQSSRGIGIYKEDTFESMIQKVKEQFNLGPNDYTQVAEYKKNANHIHEAFGVPHHKKGFCEVGFRIPKLLNFYKKQGFKKVLGYDINPFNVKVGKYLGYDCRVLDLNKEGDIDLSGCDFVACYHVLEHLSDPYAALKKIVNSLESGAILQAEIPVEGDMPNLAIGHLFPFKNGDLSKMLETLPVVITNLCTNKFVGDKIERVVCIKR